MTEQFAVYYAASKGKKLPGDTDSFEVLDADSEADAKEVFYAMEKFKVSHPKIIRIADSVDAYLTIGRYNKEHKTK